MTSPDIVSFTEVEQAGLSDWRRLFDTLRARYRTGDFATGLRLVNRIGALAEEANHHPDVDLRYPTVAVTLWSHDVGGVTSRDVDLARLISRAAADLDVEADPSSLSVVEIALDTADHEEIKPFWRAVLGLTDDPETDTQLFDLVGSLPTVWFQHTEPHDEPRQRFHLDIRVPAEVAEQRIAAALDAGGTLVTDEYAPRFWVLADAQGNKACVTTGRGRG
ncbi:4a-hydroxytetrahydrobiopterin dehydratase [Nocardioides sp.]|jgi:4a-hydroxytetrahydrobiopterin dehydratase|uniref:4a-hydroxytetrahydrobiopterin dehydratase n=1 Tax=Nocardioides sp. TaxID=35761 RepID=UPI002F3E660B